MPGLFGVSSGKHTLWLGTTFSHERVLEICTFELEQYAPRSFAGGSILLCRSDQCGRAPFMFATAPLYLVGDGSEVPIFRTLVGGFI